MDIAGDILYLTGELETNRRHADQRSVIRKRKQEAQRRWVEKNPGYFEDRYAYVKEWRRKKKDSHHHSGKMIQDKIPPSESMQTYVLLIPEAKTGVIQDEIILRRLGGSTFAAYG